LSHPDCLKRVIATNARHRGHLDYYWHKFKVYVGVSYFGKFINSYPKYG